MVKIKITQKYKEYMDQHDTTNKKKTYKFFKEMPIVLFTCIASLNSVINVLCVEDLIR